MVEFIRAYQGFLIDHYDVRLLMTGLQKNISKLESNSTLTFLYIAPKIRLSPLSIPSIAYSYQTTFDINEEDSIRLAKFTKGYEMAYQLLGDILFRSNSTSITNEIKKEFDLKIGDSSYEIIWRELTDNERNILTCIAKGFITNEEIMAKLSISKGNLAIYKKRLDEEGIISTKIRGKSEFLLPRFEEFILFKEKILNTN